MIVGKLYLDWLFVESYCRNKGQSLSTASANKSQTSGENNGKSPICYYKDWYDFNAKTSIY